LAVDIGGTKMAAALVNVAGELTTPHTVSTPRVTDPGDVWAALRSVVDAALTDGTPDACGVGCGGPMSPGGELVSPLNIPGWRDFPLRARLSSHLGIPVTIDNDAKALALGEGWLGAAAGCRDFIAMVVSTGVGGGIVLDGRLLDGAQGNAGHIGHVIVVPDGEPCACGGRGCLEAHASGPSIERITGAPPRDASAEVRRSTGTLVGRAIADVANLLDLQLAVVAGSVALGFGADFFDAAQLEIDQLARISFARGTRVMPAGLGANGPLIGAAALAFRAGAD
jgi:glucokinase